MSRVVEHPYRRGESRRRWVTGAHLVSDIPHVRLVLARVCLLRHEIFKFLALSLQNTGQNVMAQDASWPTFLSVDR